jgi:hypothetical protein
MGLKRSKVVQDLSHTGIVVIFCRQQLCMVPSLFLPMFQPLAALGRRRYGRGLAAELH